MVTAMAHRNWNGDGKSANWERENDVKTELNRNDSRTWTDNRCEKDRSESKAKQREEKVFLWFSECTSIHEFSFIFLVLFATLLIFSFLQLRLRILFLCTNDHFVSTSWIETHFHRSISLASSPHMTTLLLCLSRSMAAKLHESKCRQFNLWPTKSQSSSHGRETDEAREWEKETLQNDNH